MIVCQALTGTGGKGGLPGGEGGKEPGEEQGSARGEAPKSNASFDMGHVLNSKSAIQKDMAKAMKKMEAIGVQVASYCMRLPQQANSTK